jgi:hypothetical protein
VVALLGVNLLDDLVDAGVAFKRGRMEERPASEAGQAGQTMLGILERDAPDDAMDLVTLIEKILGEIGAVLARNPVINARLTAIEIRW